MRLCAVFRAIFLPATLVDEGCFFFAPAAVDFVCVFDDSSRTSLLSSPCPFGFIWMIFRDLVGGGGRANASLFGAGAIDERLLVLTSSPAVAGDVADSLVGYDDDATEVLREGVEVEFGPATTAGGGSSKDI